MRTQEENKSISKIIDVPCTECKRATKHRVLTSIDLQEELHEVNYYTNYQIVQCQGCESISFRVLSVNTDNYFYDDVYDTMGLNETIVLYPDRNVGRAFIKDEYLLPPNIKRIYKETINALNNQQPVLGGIGIRALVETICKDKQANGKDLFHKINDLVTIGVLTTDGATILHKIRTLGNEAAHEVKPHEFEQLSLAMDVCEHLLQGVYILPEHAKETFI